MLYLMIQILLLIPFLFAINFVYAQNEMLVLEWEQHWPTYGVGGTCNFGTHNFFVGDVDNDGIVELLTGGMTYSGDYHNSGEVEAPFGIWNWDGENFTLEVYHTWKGILNTIYAADLDADGQMEIITAGRVTNSTTSYSSIGIWSWNNKDLVLKSSLEGLSASSIHVGDLDGDGIAEILTSGSIIRDDEVLARLSVLRWENEQLFQANNYEWSTDGRASARSVHVCDLDNDGVVEVITGGYNHHITNSSGQLRIWQWDGEELMLKANQEWRLMEGVYGVTVTGDPMGNTLVENVKAADIDGDGVTEILTGGFAFDGEKMNSQLRIWNWNGLILVLEESREWFIEDITEIKAIAIEDVSGDGSLEILVSGGSAVYGGFDPDAKPESAFLSVWDWDGDVLSLKAEENWIVGDGVFAWNVGTGDVDGDGTVEIVTVGCMYINELCDPDLRIWSLSASETASFPYILFVVAGTVTVALVAVVVYFVRKRR